MAKKRKLGFFGWLLSVLILLGAVNWGIIGVTSFTDNEFNLVESLLGNFPVFLNIVYILVGLAGLLGLVGLIQMLNK